MMRLAVSLCIFILGFILATAAFAHPPSDIVVKVSGTTVEITVVHPVRDPATHYINKITVDLNGAQMIQQRYSLQTGNEQRAVYQIPSLKKGDKVAVEADCNQFGDLKREITAG